MLAWLSSRPPSSPGTSIFRQPALPLSNASNLVVELFAVEPWHVELHGQVSGSAHVDDLPDAAGRVIHRLVHPARRSSAKPRRRRPTPWVWLSSRPPSSPGTSSCTGWCPDPIGAMIFRPPAAIWSTRPVDRQLSRVAAVQRLGSGCRAVRRRALARRAARPGVRIRSRR